MAKKDIKPNARESTEKKVLAMANNFMKYLLNTKTNPTIYAMCSEYGVSHTWYYNVFLIYESKINIIGDVVNLLDSRKQNRVSAAEQVFYEIATGKSYTEGARIKAAENLIKIYGTSEQRKALNGISVEVESNKPKVDLSGLTNEEIINFVRSKK